MNIVKLNIILLTLLATRYIYKNIIYLPGILYNYRHPILSFKEIDWTVKREKSEIISDLPNILLIIVDDLGINDLSDEISPNINSVYKNGIKFINAYSAHATYSPSRV